MNRNNEYFNGEYGISTFLQSHHPALFMKTRTTLNSQELIKGSFPSLPVISIKYCKRIIDPVKEFIKIKKDYVKRRSILESRIIRSYKTKKISKENKIIDKNFKDYIIHKFLDPLPYIDLTDQVCFYPHRGTLTCFETDSSEFLVSIGDSNTISFHEIAEKMPFTTINSIHDQTKPKELIINDNSDFCAVRYRNNVKTAKIPEQDDIKDGSSIKTFENHEFKEDLLACSLNGQYLTTIDSKYKLRRKNLIYGFEDVNIRFQDYYVDDNLIPISLGTPVNEILKNHCTSYTTKDTFGILDVRNKSKIAADNYFTSKDLSLNCEKIYSHLHSKFNKNLVYIASSHLIYGYDYRKLKEPVVYWTHQLYKPPMMLESSMYGLKEIICASSFMVGDVKLFNNDGESVNLYPFKPPSVLNTYNRLRENGLFLLSDDIKERVIDASITGISLFCIPKLSQIKLFTQNYFGDVFESNLKCLKIESNDDIREETERFQLWENFLNVPLNPNKELTAKERVAREDFMIDDIVKFENLPKYLHDKSIHIEELEFFEPENQKVHHNPKWKADIAEARECNDLLAKEIMYLWEDVDDEEFDQYMEENVNDEAKGKDKVSRWLETNEPDQLDEMIIDSEDFTPEIVSTQMSVANTSNLNEKSMRKKSRVVGF